MIDAVIVKDGQPKPIGVFLSYAIEDSDIVDQFYLALQVLRERVGNNVAVFRDRTSIRPGDKIGRDIRDALRFSEYLLVFYTSRLKKSHSWTGVELGFYQSLQEDDTPRRIVPIYIGEPPITAHDDEGVNITISSEELSMSREDFRAFVAAGKMRKRSDGKLSQLLKDIARQTIERFPEHGLNDDERDDARSERTRVIDEKIVPEIWIGMYDCLGGRIARRTIEQRLLEFEVDAAELKALSRGVPASARITNHGALELFGLDGTVERLTWARFVSDLNSAYNAESAAIRRAIERVFETAVSSNASVDNDQLVLSPVNQRIYRVIVTRHFDYYNGNKIVNLYLIELRRRDSFGDHGTTILLAFINITARYRALFLEVGSELSHSAFAILQDRSKYAEVQLLVHRLMQELILIEDESERLKLASPSASVILWGRDADYGLIGAMASEWIEVRTLLKTAADAVLAADVTAPEFEDVRSKWLDSLTAFTTVTSRMNSRIGLQALRRLQVFFDDAHDGELEVGGSPPPASGPT